MCFLLRVTWLWCAKNSTIVPILIFSQDRNIIYLEVFLNSGGTLKAISDPVRRNILELLKDDQMSAGDIAEKFDLTNATVSYHLS